MLIGQQPPYINQWMGEVELCWLTVKELRNISS